MAVVTTYEEETFTLALGVFSLVRWTHCIWGVMREHFMVGDVYLWWLRRGWIPTVPFQGMPMVT